MPADFGGGIFAEQGAFACLEVCQHDAAVIGLADVTDVGHHLVHGLEEVLGAAELDAGLEHIGSCLCRKALQGIRVHFGRQFLRVGAVALERVFKIEGQAEDVEPDIEPFWVNVGVHRLFEDGAAIDKMFEVQVLGDIRSVFLTWDEPLAKRHVDKIATIFFEGIDICLVPDFDTHLAVAVRLFFDGHDAGHRIELIDIFL